MSLHPVRPAHHEDGRVQHRQHPLRLGREVGVAGGVEEGHFGIPEGEDRLFREDGDPPLPLQRAGVEEGVLMVDPPQLPELAAGI